MEIHMGEKVCKIHVIVFKQQFSFFKYLYQTRCNHKENLKINFCKYTSSENIKVKTSLSMKNTF